MHRHLAACDVAVVQGGLTTTMDLTASGRPFLYFPLERHFEQNRHVAHRLDRYRAGRRMSFADSPHDVIAVAMATAVTTASTVGYAGAGEQSRARYPEVQGYAERDGQRLYFEVYGDGDQTLFLLPPWSIVHSRHWKMQIP